jgi:sugar/nucleoside kinase (ribokinase family)
LSAAIAAVDLVRCPAPPARIVDTTGSGDNFDAGFLVAMLEGAELPEALARAVSSGTIALSGRGGTGRLATAAEATQLAARLPIRRAAGHTSTPVPAEEPR